MNIEFKGAKRKRDVMDVRLNPRNHCSEVVDFQIHQDVYDGNISIHIDDSSASASVGDFTSRSISLRTSALPI